MKLFAALVLNCLACAGFALDDADSGSARAWAQAHKLSAEHGDAKQGAELWYVPDRSEFESADGWFAEHIWQTIPAHDFIFLDGSGDTPQAPTVGRMLTSRGVLHFRFDCADPDAQHLVYTSIGRDWADLWKDDCIEIFLRATDERAADCAHLIINPAGAVSANGPSTVTDWDPPIRRRATINAQGWRAELALPLRTLAAGEVPIVWCGNISRSRKGREGACAEETSWRSTGEMRTNLPEKFGFWYFAAVEKGLEIPPPSSFAIRGQDILALTAGREEASDILRGRYGCPALIVPRDADAELHLQAINDYARSSRDATIARVRRQDNGLRISVQCFEHDLTSIQSERTGGDVWMDDSIEIFIAKDRSESDDYRQINVNAAGAYATNKANKPAPIDGLQVQATRGDDYWQVDVTVPFAAFKINAGAVPAMWGFNVVRNRPRRAGEAEQTMIWSKPSDWSVHDPARFGTLWLEKADLLPELGSADELTRWAARGSSLRPVARERSAEDEFDWDVLSVEEKTQLRLTAMVSNGLKRYVQQAYAERDQRWNELKDWASWEKIRNEMRANFWRALGQLPATKCPLNPRVSQVYADEEVVCERMLYESRPNFHVSGTLYTPVSQAGAKAPAVIMLTGHTPPGRFAYLWQSEEIARTGYVVLAIDVIGQGERIDINHGYSARNVTTNHHAEGAACILTGGNLAQYMAHDVMRGIDYLESRKEVDPARIVVTGSSGGGSMTAYVAALDERVVAAAPVSALHNQRGSGGNYDCEQVLYGAFPCGLDTEGLLAMIAPRPAIVISEPNNEEHVASNRFSYERSRKIYALKGAGDKLEYLPTAGPHGYGQTHLKPFKEWLARTVPPNAGTPAYSGKKVKLTRDAYQASKAGTVFYSRELPGATTVYELNAREIDLQLAYDRGIRTAGDASGRAADIRARLRTLLALPEIIPAPISATRKSSASFDGFGVERWLIETESGIYIPSVLLRAAGDGRHPAVIWIGEHGKRSIITARWPRIRSLLENGIDVLIPDLRGTGESAADSDSTFLGIDAELTGFSHQVSHPLIGLRVFDALGCAAWLRGRDDVDGERVGMIGDSLSGFNPPLAQPRLITDPGLEPIQQAQSLGPTVAMLALTLDTKLSCGALRGGIASYSQICPQMYFLHPWSTFVPGILKSFDIADCYGACAPRPLFIAGSVDALNQRLERADEPGVGFTRAIKAYDLADALSAISIRGGADIGECVEFMRERL
jgi:cephalosporin-C deacetylase-like acetyl esterase